MKQYKKSNLGNNRKVTSVNLTPEQYQFLKTNHIDLSKFVREKLAELIQESERLDELKKLVS